MQRSSFWLLLLVTLYVSACATATRDKSEPLLEKVIHVEARPLISAGVVTKPTLPGEPDMTVLTPSVIGTTALPPGTIPLLADKFAPHIALILPLKSTLFASAAQAVQQGFLMAASVQARDFPVRIYNSSEEGKDAIAIYRQVIANGAVAVAGPLTRADVTLLTAYPEIHVPTLVLNTTEQKAASSKLYFFSLNPEAEARQVAQLAFAAKLHDATTISSGTALAKRLAAAFADEWKKLGGNINDEVVYKEGDNTNVLTNLPTAPWLVEPEPVTVTVVLPSGAIETVTPKRVGPPPAAPGNVVFLAAESKQARLIRPYLNPSLPIYASSQLFNMESDTLTNYDLNDIRFVDMPWLLQPDHAAVMIYTRSEIPMDTDRDRLYAFGIDAYRLLNILLNNKLNKSLPLDGVTGRIRLSEFNVFQRDAQAAVFKYGHGLTPDGVTVMEAQRAAAKASANAAHKALGAENAETKSAQ